MSTSPDRSRTSSLVLDSSSAQCSAPPLTHLWAMTVGISHYPHLPPLPCAERDAQDLHGWLTQQAGVSRERALLLTETSRAFYQRSTQPDRATLSYWIGQLRSHGIQRGDTFWFFFSGYGETWNGDDYLLPIDAHRTPPQAWIKLSSLLRALKSLPTDRMVVFLDLHHRPSIQGEAHLGEQTIQIAQQLGITVVLTHQSHPLSSMAPLLTQGVFTTALLNTLRTHPTQNGLTQFLNRFKTYYPTLCTQCNRSPQLPQMTIAELPLFTLPTRVSETLSDCLTTGDLRRHARPPIATETPARPIRSVVRSQSKPIDLSDRFFHESTPVLPKTIHPHSNLLPTPIHSPAPKPLTLEFKFVCLTGLLALCSIVPLIWLGNRSIAPRYTNHLTVPSATPRPSPSAPSPAITPLQVPEQPAGDSTAILEEARNYITPTKPEELLRAIDRISQIPPGDPGYAIAQRQIDRWSEQLFRLAQLEANQGRWRNAIEIATQVRTDRKTIYTQAQQSIQVWKRRL